MNSRELKFDRDAVEPQVEFVFRIAPHEWTVKARGIYQYW